MGLAFVLMNIVSCLEKWLPQTNQTRTCGVAGLDAGPFTNGRVMDRSEPGTSTVAHVLSPERRRLGRQHLCHLDLWFSGVWTRTVSSGRCAALAEAIRSSATSCIFNSKVTTPLALHAVESNRQSTVAASGCFQDDFPKVAVELNCASRCDRHLCHPSSSRVVCILAG
mgnify:CR=1 FL=1